MTMIVITSTMLYYISLLSGIVREIQTAMTEIN